MPASFNRKITLLSSGSPPTLTNAFGMWSVSGFNRVPNPAANITGNMLEDEKAFHTCHFAIGENYDNDAPSLIHLDGVVREPTITLTYGDGSSRTILQDGALQI